MVFICSAPQAQALAEENAATLLLVRVAESKNKRDRPGILVERDWRAAHQARLTEVAKHYLSDMKQTLQKAGIKVMSFIENPPSGEAILQIAKQQQADLIVMSTRARTGLERWVYGNTAETILREGTCPVLLLRKQK